MPRGLLLICVLLSMAPAFAFEGRPTSSLGVAPSWSPDGRLIAYQSPDYDIYMMNNDGTHRRALTSDLYRDEQPAWSPDGERIAYVSERGGAQELWIIGLDGGATSKLTSGQGWKHSPSWSPDASGIAYVVSPEKNGQGDIWIIDVANGRESQLTRDGNARSPAWHPNGKEIAYLRLRPGGYDIILSNVDNGAERLLVSDSHWKSQLSWSPDGKSLAFASYRDGNYDVYVLSDGGIDRMTKRASWDISPAWSPEGTRVAYASDHGGMYDVWVTDLEIPIAAAKEIAQPAPTPALAEMPSAQASAVAMGYAAEERSRLEERDRAPSLELSSNDVLREDQFLVAEAASYTGAEKMPLDSGYDWQILLELLGLLALSTAFAEALVRISRRLEFRLFRARVEF